jgi:hypothetical protein
LTVIFGQPPVTTEELLFATELLLLVTEELLFAAELLLLACALLFGVGGVTLLELPGFGGVTTLEEDGGTGAS